MNVEDRLAAFESQMVEVLAQFATLRGMQDTLDKECERLRAENRTLRNRAVELDSEKDRLIELLNWARTCVPFPSDCHDAIHAALKENYKP